MAALRPASLIVILAWTSVFAHTAAAAQFSEVFMAGGTTQIAADAVEVIGLSTSQTYDLVVIDAAPDRHGDVITVLTLNPSTSTLMVADNPWSATWLPSTDATPTIRTIAQLGETGSLALGGARAYLLFDQDTGLLENRVNLFTDPAQQARIADATLLDRVTLTDGPAASTVGEETAVPIDSGWAAARASDPDTGDLRPWWSGPASELGDLVNTRPRLELTPGAPNPFWVGNFPGDLDLDGDVDLDDFEILAVNFGRTDQPTALEGNLDEDGDVDLTDFNIFAAQFDLTPTSETIGLPSPGVAGAVLVLLPAATARAGRVV